MKKKVLLICVCLALAIVIIGAVGGAFYVLRNGGSVTRISLSRKSDSEMDLQIGYLLPSGKYSVRNVPEDEGEYIGDGMTDYNGELGKYRIIIEFGDAGVSDSLSGRADENGVFELADGVFAKIAYPSDHGFVLYVGSDSPISVEESDPAELNDVFGTVRISVAVGDERLAVR